VTVKLDLTPDQAQSLIYALLDRTSSLDLQFNDVKASLNRATETNRRHVAAIDALIFPMGDGGGREERLDRIRAMVAEITDYHDRYGALTFDGSEGA
jgi:hypothetical protein